MSVESVNRIARFDFSNLKIILPNVHPQKRTRLDSSKQYRRSESHISGVIYIHTLNTRLNMVSTNTRTYIRNTFHIIYLFTYLYFFNVTSQFPLTLLRGTQNTQMVSRPIN